MRYQPGDVVNGYRLNEDGTAWVPVASAAAVPPPPSGFEPSQHTPHSGMSTGAKVGIGVAVIGLLGVGVVGLAAAASSASSTYSATYSCEDIAADAIAISEEDRAVNGYAMLQIYNQEVVYEGHSGDVRVPPGETSTVVFECTGDAVWSDADETPLVYGVEIDVNGDEWVYYEVL